MDKNDKLTNEEKILIEALRKWNDVKIHINLYGRQNIPKEGGIYWACIGENVGDEMYGKSDYFTRPVLVYKKLSRYRFMGIPLTSKPHEGSWYVPFVHNGKKQVAVIGQARVMNIKRLLQKIGEADDADMRKIRRAFIDLYS